MSTGVSQELHSPQKFDDVENTQNTRVYKVEEIAVRVVHVGEAEVLEEE
jgi:hypothetical protein